MDGWCDALLTLRLCGLVHQNYRLHDYIGAAAVSSDPRLLLIVSDYIIC